MYADLGGFSRCSKADWDEIARKIKKLENDCQASWDNLRAIAKHDSSTFLRNKYVNFKKEYKYFEFFGQLIMTMHIVKMLVTGKKIQVRL